ncbi:MAG: phosphonate C-P lyase system protein PhnH [Stenomitos rutilans HA7619-LM2]|nr:phosphonate C-P lyase system protein PhnH [Stenomitos rutilans HA7619-LM2]
MITVDAIWQAETQQKIFHALLNCMSLPGEIADLSHYLGKSSALVGVLATLLDGTVSLSDEDGLISKNDRHLLQASTAPSAIANFVIKDATKPPQDGFSPNLGELPNPEKGATLILQGETLGIGDLSLQLTGPGVNGARQTSIMGFHSEWFMYRQQWVENFPLGVDLCLVTSAQIMAIPRSIKIQNLKSKI